MKNRQRKPRLASGYFPYLNMYTYNAFCSINMNVCCTASFLNLIYFVHCGAPCFFFSHQIYIYWIIYTQTEWYSHAYMMWGEIQASIVGMHVWNKKTILQKAKPSTLQWIQIRNTAPYQSLWGKLTLPQPKPAHHFSVIKFLWLFHHFSDLSLSNCQV